ncbi:hypothetical protein I6946_04500 [Helicobacter pylori]|uniref:hypothetical protein n=1 Tax=Helicobacter pylori TaxID=210 RepID=UPI0018D052CD|nr:hypothetical protein [Helicobacter pylori]MBH0308097.1 hypothetical protein [Helicobacter pylori]
MIATPQTYSIDSDTILSYIFKDKVKPSDDWFNTPFKSAVLKPLLTDKRGMIDRKDLSFWHGVVPPCCGVGVF